MENKKIKFFNISIIIALIITMVLSNFTVFAKECNNIRKNVLRLHIIANSDSEFDQSVKLKIRDQILLESGDIFGDSKDITVAKENVTNNIEKIESIANKVLSENGVSMVATATVCNMFFNTKKYEKFTMPAGKYDALRITIGEAKGKNWWCVLYPALCIPAASENTIDEAFSPEEQEVVTSQKPEYEIKFASVEIWEKIVNFFSHN